MIELVVALAVELPIESLTVSRNTLAPAICAVAFTDEAPTTKPVGTMLAEMLVLPICRIAGPAENPFVVADTELIVKVAGVRTALPVEFVT